MNKHLLQSSVGEKPLCPAVALSAGIQVVVSMNSWWADVYRLSSISLTLLLPYWHQSPLDKAAKASLIAATKFALTCRPKAYGPSRKNQDQVCRKKSCGIVLSFLNWFVESKIVYDSMTFHGQMLQIYISHASKWTAQEAHLSILQCHASGIWLMGRLRMYLHNICCTTVFSQQPMSRLRISQRIPAGHSRYGSNVVP